MRALDEMVENLHRRCIILLREELDHAAEQAKAGELDLERYRWLLRCQKEVEKLPLTTQAELNRHSCPNSPS